MTDNILAALTLTTLAGLATGVGGLISYLIPRPDGRYLSVSLGFATGVMIYVAFVDLFAGAREVIGLEYTSLFFLLGLIVIFFVDRLVPHVHIDGRPDLQGDRIYHSGVMTTLGIAIHNLPEGMTVALVTLADVRLGVSVAMAIAIHNIPEGIACCVPLYCATGNRARACLVSFYAGMTEPLGALVAVVLLYPILNEFVLAASTALVAGIMVFLCFDELIPVANAYGDEHLTNVGIILGIAVIMIGLIVIEG